MTLFDQILIVVAMAIICGATPVTLVWGWARWTKRPKERSTPAKLSLAGFMLASASGLLAVSLLIYVRLIGGFSFHDPWLLRMYRWGLGCSLAGIVFALSGVWRSSSLRWHAIAGSAGTLLFWIVAAEGE